MGLPYITATTSLYGYAENQQVLKTDEDKSLISHNFAKQNCLGEDFPMLGTCNYILMREKNSQRTSNQKFYDLAHAAMS